MSFTNNQYRIAVFTTDTIPYYHGSGRNAFHFASALNRIGAIAYVISLNKLLKFTYKKQYGNTLIYRLPISQRNKLFKALTFLFCFLFYIYHIIVAKQILLYGRIVGYEFILLFAWLLRKPVYFQSTLLHADDLESINQNNRIVRILGLTKIIRGYFAINPVFADLSVNYLHPSAKIFVSPQGVDQNKFFPVVPERRQELRRQYNIPNSQLILCTVGILCKRKGYKAMFEQLQDLAIDFKLLVVGDYDPHPDNCFVVFRSEMSELKKVGEALLGDRIQFVGTTEYPEEFLQLSDYFIFNSDHEGTPNAILEAMSCKIPIVCKRLEGIESILNDTSATVYSSDSELKDALQFAIANDVSAKTESAFEYSQQFCSIESVAQQFLEFVRE